MDVRSGVVVRSGVAGVEEDEAVMCADILFALVFTGTWFVLLLSGFALGEISWLEKSFAGSIDSLIIRALLILFYLLRICLCSV